MLRSRRTRRPCRDGGTVERICRGSEPRPPGPPAPPPAVRRAVSARRGVTWRTSGSPASPTRTRPPCRRARDVVPATGRLTRTPAAPGSATVTGRTFTRTSRRAVRFHTLSRRHSATSTVPSARSRTSRRTPEARPGRPTRTGRRRAVRAWSGPMEGQEVPQGRVGGLRREVAAQEAEVLLGLAQGRLGGLVEQLVGVGAADARDEVLEERAQEVDRPGLLGDRGLAVARPGRRLEARLGRPHRLAARDAAHPRELGAHVRGRRGQAAGVGVDVPRVEEGVLVAEPPGRAGGHERRARSPAGRAGRGGPSPCGRARARRRPARSASGGRRRSGRTRWAPRARRRRGAGGRRPRRRGAGPMRARSALPGAAQAEVEAHPVARAARSTARLQCPRSSRATAATRVGVEAVAQVAARRAAAGAATTFGQSP